MDERSSEISSSHSQPKALFPISGYAGSKDGCVQPKASLLFPCASSETGHNSRVTPADQQGSGDWLFNPSYTGPVSDVGVQKQMRSYNFATQATKLDSSDYSDEEEKPKKIRKYASDSDSYSSEKERKKTRHKKKRKHKSKHKKKEKVPKEDLREKPNTIWLEESGLDLKDAYRIHRKPDLGNLSYGSLYRLDIANYKIRSRGVCLGLNKKQAVILMEKRKKDKKKEKEKESRYWRTKLPGINETEMVISKKKTAEFFTGKIENYSYVPVDLPSGGNVNGSENMGSEETSDHNSMDAFALKQTAELNKKISDNPHDISTWLELVKLQEEIVQGKDSSVAGFSESFNEVRKKNRRVVLEKKMAVLEKALEQNPLSEELIEFDVELCSEIGDTGQLIRRWNKIVFTHPNKPSLWRKYLRFMQSRFSSFSFRKAQAAHIKCLGTLLAIREGTFKSHQAEDDLEGDMLDLFVQYCWFMKQSGHMEKVVASYQAMIELNCFSPKTVSDNTPTSGQVAFLETFWDSGEQRFGEPGAKGWKAWMDKSMPELVTPVHLDLGKIFKTNSTPNDLDTDDANEEEDQLIQGLPKWLAWLNIEILRDHTQLKPWQPDQELGQTEDDCEDPERLVLFDDIKDGLFKLKEPQNKIKLVLHFLEILGVPVQPRMGTKHFESEQYFGLATEDQKQVLGTGIPGKGWQKRGYWYDHPVKTWPSMDLLSLVRHVFDQALVVFDNQDKDELMVTWLWYEYTLACDETTEKGKKQRVKEVQRLAKALLKQPGNRNNLTLWREFACLLWDSGDKGESRRIFDSTLAMAGQLGCDHLIPVALYRVYAESEIKSSLSPSLPSSVASDHNQRAVYILAHLAEGSLHVPYTSTTESISPARTLKTKRTLSELCDASVKCLNQGATDSKCGQETTGQVFTATTRSSHLDTILCCILFTYATQGFGATLERFQNIMNVLVAHSTGLNGLDFHREILWLSFMRLTRDHMQLYSVHLKHLRPLFRQALREFPNNPELMEFFLHVESKSNLTGEVRRFLDHSVQVAKTPVQWVFALHYEELRSKAVVSAMDCSTAEMTDVSDAKTAVAVTTLPLTGITYRQRALFDRVTSGSVGRQCVMLWRMYIEFEMKQSGKERAKAVFYQAIHQCPWAKSLYLDAVKHFPDEVEEIIDMMHEKELRVRVPLEELDLLLQAA